jgi:anthranilate synthase/aminodeoxychorismate synthase-like glutamine amidotransferase
MVLVIDNYDSFTYNLVQYLGELGAGLVVKRNDEITVSQVEKMAPDKILISPGPCTPNEAGISCELIQRLGPRFPLLGVCLGHQCIGQAFGGEIVRAKRLMHGKTSWITHENSDIFQGLPNPFEATRYHSLVIKEESFPESLRVTARNTGEEEVEIMGLKHKEFPIYGVQFHPESILTRCGKELLKNFLTL